MIGDNKFVAGAVAGVNHADEIPKVLAEILKKKVEDLEPEEILGFASGLTSTAAVLMASFAKQAEGNELAHEILDNWATAISEGLTAAMGKDVSVSIRI